MKNSSYSTIGCMKKIPWQGDGSPQGQEYKKPVWHKKISTLAPFTVGYEIFHTNFTFTNLIKITPLSRYNLFVPAQKRLTCNKVLHYWGVLSCINASPSIPVSLAVV